MIDRRILSEQPDLVREHLRRRHADDATVAAVSQVGELMARRVALIQERDVLKNERNTLSKQIGQLYKTGKGDEAEAMKAKVKAGGERVAVIETELEQVEAEWTLLAMGIPNLLHDDVPEGKTEDDNVEIKRWGEPRTDLSESHVEIGERLGLLDLERSAKLTGARFSILHGALARLERALYSWFLDLHTSEHGYSEINVPFIVHRGMAEGTGQLPKFEDQMFRLAEPLNGQDAFLIPTAEVPVTNVFRGEILENEELPFKFAAFSACFRSEAGSAGRDVRGLIRQHQFFKVELVWISTPERAEDDHLALLGHAETVLQKLGLPYRVVVHCGGETSFSATRCFDIEVWMPSQGTFREISSVSHFTDYQARRMALRYRPALEEGQKKAKPRLCHTLNGSGLAVGRTLVAILENFVQPDGSVEVPEVLRPYMGGLERIEATDRFKV